MLSQGNTFNVIWQNNLSIQWQVQVEYLHCFDVNGFQDFQSFLLKYWIQRIVALST